jgi:hypothetical protein
MTVFVLYERLPDASVFVFSTVEKLDAFVAHRKAQGFPLHKPWIEEVIVDDEEVKRDEG